MSDKNKEAPFQNFKSYKDAYEGYIQYFEEQDCYGLSFLLLDSEAPLILN